MSGITTSSIRSDVQARIDALQAEIGQLNGVLAALGTDVPAPKATRRQSQPVEVNDNDDTDEVTETESRERKLGRRVEQILVTLANADTGMTVKALAGAMGARPTYLYRVLPKLVANGQVKVFDADYYASDAVVAEFQSVKPARKARKATTRKATPKVTKATAKSTGRKQQAPKATAKRTRRARRTAA